MPATLADIQAKYGDSVYPLYKDEMHEPYMENDSGIGYKGVVMHNELEDKIQCSECGGWYKSVTSHVRSFHKQNVYDYKKKVGLAKTIPLVNIGTSEKLSKNANINKNKEFFLSEVRPKRVKKLLERKKNLKKLTYRSDKYTASYVNKFGLCDAQIAARLIVIKQTTGKNIIASGDVGKYDHNLYIHLIRKYGGIDKACKELGLAKSKVGGVSPYDFEDAKLLGLLRKYVIDNKKIPNGRNQVGYGSWGTYKKHFGSWRRAKMMAGLDQLLKEVKE